MAQSMIELFKAARRVSTPLMAIHTPDPAATIQLVLQAYKTQTEVPAILCHDIVRGLVGMNQSGAEALYLLFTDAEVAEVKEKKEQGAIADEAAALSVILSNPVEVLIRIQKLPKKAVVFLMNADRFLDQPGFVQAFWNLRDEFKADRRTAVLLMPGGNLPIALAQDVLVLDEPYPDRKQLEEIVLRAHSDSKFPVPKTEILTKAVDALMGLPAFPAEQQAFISMVKGQGLDIDGLWERKRKTIEQAVGASVWRGAERFSHICGLSNLIKYCGAILKGKRKVGLVLFLDEIEKTFAGLKSDTSGVSQKMFGAMLTWMQDHNVIGLLLLGPPGTGKSLLAKAIGNEAGVPTIAGDISGMEASLVGDSQKNLRAFLKMVEAVSGGETILVVATCNDVNSLPPELRRRFKRGTFFIDLMTPEEREGAWKFYMKKFNLTDKKRPDDTNWTGAEVEQCCEMANDMNMTLVEAAEFVVPVAQSSSDQIDKLRRFAAGRFIAASYPGKYKMPAKPLATNQKREVE